MVIEDGRAWTLFAIAVPVAAFFWNPSISFNYTAIRAPVTSWKSIPETCQACGLFVKRCPMKALELVPSPEARNKQGKASALKEGQCIGCGVCAYKCPTQSLGLVRRPEEQDFPKNFREQVYRIGKERGRLLF